MKYKIEFQYKPQGAARPYDEVQEEHIFSDTGGYIPIPDVGDSVSYGKEGRRAYKVVSRHFSYVSLVEDWCVVNIVVTDISDEEMAARLKE